VIYTVGELRDALAAYPDDKPVRVFVERAPSYGRLVSIQVVEATEEGDASIVMLDTVV